MWFADIDIDLQRGGHHRVAPGRHDLARQRYEERKRGRLMLERQHQDDVRSEQIRHGAFRAVRAVGGAIASILRRRTSAPAAGAVPSVRL